MSSQDTKKGRIKKLSKKIILLLIILLLSLILFGLLRYGVVLVKIQKEAKRIVEESNTSTFRSAQTSLIYDANGTLITAMKSEKDVYYIKFDQIPDIVKEAFVSIEDKKFYNHSGVDLKANLRAMVVLVQNKGEITQGGSTITQQLARTVFLNQDVTVKRKVNEIFIAMELEKKYSKDQILEFYINNIYFGNGYYGIEAAAKGYFNRDVKELTLSETAFLCAIPNNPSIYDPFKHMDKTKKRRDRILKALKADGKIDKTLYEAAINQEITLSPSENGKNNYVETYARYCATIELMKKRGFVFTNEFSSDAEKEIYEQQYELLYSDCSRALFTGGYRIYTSIDLTKQEQLQQTLDARLSVDTQTDGQGIYKFQGSATCIDNQTGLVVAIVGGRSQEYPGYTINRAFQSFRQPGSTIKPILIYTPIFERGYTPDTDVVDEEIEGGPVNSPDRYDGQMTIRTAVEKSKNTVAWKLFQELTPEVGIQYLKNMNFSKIDKNDYVPAMAIGGMTYGVSTLEMASAYGTIENDGVYRSPTCIVKIMDSDNNIIVDNAVTEKVIYQKEAARMMTDVLRGVLVSGTGKKYQMSNAVCAAKTGTTNGNRDIWFVGYSAYYTTAVWVGYDMPQDTTDTYITSSSGSIWNEFMTNLHNELPEVEFPSYQDE